MMWWLFYLYHQIRGLFWIGYGTICVLWRGRQRQVHSPQAQDLILIIPGFGGSFGQFYRLFSELYPYATQNHIALLYATISQSDSLDESVQDLVARYMKQRNWRSFVLIGHSRGGLLIEKLVQKYPLIGHKSVVINLATPYRNANDQLGFSGVCGNRSFLKFLKKFLRLIFQKDFKIFNEIKSLDSLRLGECRKRYLFVSQYDVILGDPVFQQPPSLMINQCWMIPSSHLSIPNENNLLKILSQIVKNELTSE